MKRPLDNGINNYTKPEHASVNLNQLDTKELEKRIENRLYWRTVGSAVGGVILWSIIFQVIDHNQATMDLVENKLRELIKLPPIIKEVKEPGPNEPGAGYLWRKRQALLDQHQIVLVTTSEQFYSLPNGTLFCWDDGALGTFGDNLPLKFPYEVVSEVKGQQQPLYNDHLYKKLDTFKCAHVGMLPVWDYDKIIKFN